MRISRLSAGRNNLAAWSATTILFLSFAMPLRADVATSETESMVQNSHFVIKLDGKTGTLSSLRTPTREFIHPGNAGRPLFTLRFRNARGEPLDLTSLQAAKFTMTPVKTPDGATVTLKYDSLDGKPVQATVVVKCPADKPFCYWNLTIQHDLDLYLDCIDFPSVLVPNDLSAAGGDSRLFWPGMEGVLVDDLTRREKGWVRSHPIEFPNRGWEGFYPGPCQMQFMAYYGKTGGLYIAAHDAGGNPKGIEFFSRDNGIDLSYRLYPGGIERGTYTMPYDMVLGVFEGDWHDAAEIYRNWVKNSGMPLPPKLTENNQLPSWFQDSPVIAAYPVRGVRDLGDMTPNDYYPYTKAIPPIERLSKEYDSRVMALLMHWEGSAPWAPPFVWPPFGDENDFREFVDMLHKGKNLLGLYCSGIAWTMKSNVWNYSREEQYKQENLKDIMIVAPNGETPWSLICSGPNAQRWSYDMCPANAFVGKTVADEIEKMINGGADYIQYFDQNLGGTPYLCYSRKHGHAPAPGAWMKDAMIGVLKQAHQVVEKSGKHVLIGCEAAAAEPYMPYLMLNDGRSNINLMVGIPVPAYAYVYHEYVNNFMGNQNSVTKLVDVERTPLSMLQRLAYGFVAGDLLTVVLKGGGQVHWDWGTDWKVPGPDQAQISTLIRNLNAWRRGAAKPFLYLGCMEKPLPITGSRNVPMILGQGGEIPWPSLLTSRWTSPDGRKAQIIANYLPESQECTLTGLTGMTIRVYEQASGKNPHSVEPKAGQAKLKIAPLSAIMVELP